MHFFDKNIRHLRRKKDLSQDKLAEMLGYKSYTTIQKWEMGISEPPFSKMKLLSEILDSNIDDLVNKDLTTVDQDDTSINTIAAHADSDLTEDERKKIIEYVKFIKSQRGQE